VKKRENFNAVGQGEGNTRRGCSGTVAKSGLRGKISNVRRSNGSGAQTLRLPPARRQHQPPRKETTSEQQNSPCPAWFKKKKMGEKKEIAHVEGKNQ